MPAAITPKSKPEYPNQYKKTTRVSVGSARTVRKSRKPARDEPCQNSQDDFDVWAHCCLVIDPIPNTCPLSDDSGQHRILVGGLSANDPKRTLTVRCLPLLDRATNKKFWVEYDEILKIWPVVL
ncbi:MAG: hypothetical protein WA375_03210 [Pseudolabrys sp.]